jgi:hypothetical protein
MGQRGYTSAETDQVVSSVRRDARAMSYLTCIVSTTTAVRGGGIACWSGRSACGRGSIGRSRLCAACDPVLCGGEERCAEVAG